MTVTRSQIESILVSRRSPLMQMASMAVTTQGANADLNDPIGYAVRKVGGTVASLASVTDADIATVDTDDLDEMLDHAELRLLRSIRGNLALVDITSGPMSEKLSQLAASVREDIEALENAIGENYGGGASPLETGAIVLDFQTLEDDDEEDDE